jgi:6-phospho-3-hexuloisomerase
MIMDVAKLTKIIADENLKLLGRVASDQVSLFAEYLDKAKRIFCAAQGRSGNILRCFCMRLMHLGYESYFVGETVTPRISKGDLVVVLSGSGNTICTVEMAKMARSQSANSWGILGVEDSPLGENLDGFVVLPGGTKLAGAREESVSVQPAGSLFEQAAFFLLEAIILELYDRQGNDLGALLERHTNLE